MQSPASKLSTFQNVIAILSKGLRLYLNKPAKREGSVMVDELEVVNYFATSNRPKTLAKVFKFMPLVLFLLIKFKLLSTKSNMSNMLIKILFLFTSFPVALGGRACQWIQLSAHPGLKVTFSVYFISNSVFFLKNIYFLINLCILFCQASAFIEGLLVRVIPCSTMHVVCRK